MNKPTSLAYFGAVGSCLFFVSGCLNTAYTPGALASEGQAEPARNLVAVPGRDDILRRWALPVTNPWAPYEKLTLPAVIAAHPESVMLPTVRDLDDVHLADLAAQHLAVAGVPSRSMWVVDLRGAASVAFGAALSKASRTSVAPIPTFNHWPNENELIPAEETLAAMVAFSPRPVAPDDVTARPVFMLDSWRLAYKDEVIDDETTDNRYMLSQHDFPSVDVLRAQGICEVYYVVADAEVVEREEDDLNQTFAAYVNGGIEVRITDLASLTRERENGFWYDEATMRRLWVRERFTVVSDPAFYARARGGFGGAHGSFIATGHGSWGGHGGGGHGGG